MSMAQWVATFSLAVLFLPLLMWWGLWLFFVVVAIPRGRAGRPSLEASDRPTTIDILIPAHDEELLLPRLLETLHRQTALQRIGRTLVIADHCGDRTAALAREAHAEVLDRTCGPRGKPAALRDGIAWLNRTATAAAAEPHAVLILDADCTVSPNLIEQCAATLDGGASVVQAAYLLDETRSLHGNAGGGERLHSAAAIAFALKNAVRPKGMARLGIPTQLFGTGMCFRADVLARIAFADHLTEDLAMSYDLLLAGVQPRFVAQATVRSPLPSESSAMSTQKLRWETGQVQTWSKLPVILFRLMCEQRPGWLRGAVAVIDWSAPPLAMAVLFWVGVTFASTCAVALHWASAWLLTLPVLCMACLAAYVILGGIQISGIASVARLILAVPRFFYWKFRLYLKMLAGRGPRSWQRTPRSAQSISGGRPT